MRGRCPPRAHAGPLRMRRRDARTARLQCDHCLGAVGRSIALAELPNGGERHMERWRARLPLRPARGNSRRRAYRAFLLSAEWKRQRLRVLERDGWKCQGHNCGADLRPPARATVHHRRYADVLANTPDSDLAASCNRCNLHERQARIGRDRSAERGEPR
jgi:hypothetical protein